LAESLCGAQLTLPVRDEFENNKADLEKQLSAAMGTEWKIDIDPLAVFPYAPEGNYSQRSLGSVLKRCAQDDHDID
jgi:hypothetical protein